MRTENPVAGPKNTTSKRVASEPPKWRPISFHYRTTFIPGCLISPYEAWVGEQEVKQQCDLLLWALGDGC
jgi:hypothetical protein